MMKSWKLPLRSVTKEECRLSSLLFNIVLEVLPTAIRRKEKNWKGRKKTVIFANDISVHAYILSHLSCLTLCALMNCSPPSSSVHGILQARILEWVAILSSRGSSWPRDRTCTSRGSWLLHCRQILYRWATREDFKHWYWTSFSKSRIIWKLAIKIDFNFFVR